MFLSRRFSGASATLAVTLAASAFIFACSSQDPGAVYYASARSGAPGMGGNGGDAPAQDSGTPPIDTPDSSDRPPADASMDAAATTDANEGGSAVDAPSGPTVLSFTLLDTSQTANVQGTAVTRQDPIKDKSTISLGTVGNNLSVRANLNVATVGSVGFAYGGTKHTENKAPYVLCGDDGAGTVNNCNLTAGTYTITATPYSAADLGGTAGNPLTITFALTP